MRLPLTAETLTISISLAEHIQRLSDAYKVVPGDTEEEIYAGLKNIIAMQREGASEEKIIEYINRNIRIIIKEID